jgi:hypothetical protein
MKKHAVKQPRISAKLSFKRLCSDNCAHSRPPIILVDGSDYFPKKQLARSGTRYHVHKTPGLLELGHPRCELSSFWNVPTANPEGLLLPPSSSPSLPSTLAAPVDGGRSAQQSIPRRTTLPSITFRKRGSTNFTLCQAARFLPPRVACLDSWRLGSGKRVCSGLITPSHLSSKSAADHCNSAVQTCGKVCKGGRFTVGVQDLQLCLWKGELGAAPLVQVISRGRQLVVELGLYETQPGTSAKPRPRRTKHTRSGDRGPACPN